MGFEPMIDVSTLKKEKLSFVKNKIQALRSSKKLKFH